VSDADPQHIWSRITASLDDLVITSDPTDGSILLECLRCGVIKGIDPFGVSINNLLIEVADHRCLTNHGRPT
jgi:hypothetical protein